MQTKEDRAAYMRRYQAERRKNGICTHCGKPLTDLSSSMHPECQQYKNEQRKSYRRTRREGGTCSECDQPRYKKTNLCFHHWEAQRTSRIKLVEERRRVGLCTRCGLHSRSGSADHCEECFLKMLCHKLKWERSRWVELLDLLDKQD